MSETEKKGTLAALRRWRNLQAQLSRRQFIESGLAGLGFFMVSWPVPAKAFASSPALTPAPSLQGYQLPGWYDGNRVQAHTRVPLKTRNQPSFLQVAADVKALGARVFVRNIKSGGEGAWWPSKVGAVAKQTRGKNLAAEIISSAQQQDLKLIVYYRHMEDEAMAAQHPDWVCVDWRGKRLHSKRGDYMCFNSPYVDYVLKRMLELVRMGADGLYFDEVHMPKSGCWCRFCKEKYKAETGQPVPRKADASDPAWHRYIDFNNRSIEQAFQGWRTALHAVNPGLVMLVSAHKWNTMSERHLTSGLFRIADAVKTEFNSGLRIQRKALFAPTGGLSYDRAAKQALGFVMARDAADGRPAHVWMFNIRDKEEALYAMAGVVTHGCVANMDLMGPKEAKLPIGHYREVFDWGNRVSPAFKDKVPFRGVALFYPEKARDDFVLTPGEGLRRILYPFYGAFHALLRGRVPVGVVTESQLAEGQLEGYQVLVVPDHAGWSPAQRKALEAFRQRGGKVVVQKDPLGWSRPQGLERQGRWLLNECAAAVQVPFKIEGGRQDLQMSVYVSHDRKRYTLAMCNDFSWVKSGRRQHGWAGIGPLGNRPAPVRGGVVKFLDQREPLRVWDHVRGVSLAVEQEEGLKTIKIPDFEIMSVVTVDFS